MCTPPGTFVMSFALRSFCSGLFLIALISFALSISFILRCLLHSFSASSSSSPPLPLCFFVSPRTPPFRKAQKCSVQRQPPALYACSNTPRGCQPPSSP